MSNKAKPAKQYQSRYVAYATAHDVQPVEMIARDRVEWPGGAMAGYILWIQEQLSTWRTDNDRTPRSSLSSADDIAFDAWLDAQVR